jgi:hypothetical protein
MAAQSKTVGSPVDIICNGDTIEVAFSRTLIGAPDELIGREVTLRVTDVADLALNRMASAAQWSFTVGAFDESAVSVSLTDTRVPLRLVNGSADINAAVARELAGPDGPLAQLQVTGATRRRQVQVGEQMATFDVEVAPSSSVAGGRSAVLSIRTRRTHRRDLTIRADCLHFGLCHQQQRSPHAAAVAVQSRTQPPRPHLRLPLSPRQRRGYTPSSQTSNFSSSRRNARIRLSTQTTRRSLALH